MRAWEYYRGAPPRAVFAAPPPPAVELAHVTPAAPTSALPWPFGSAPPLEPPTATRRLAPPVAPSPGYNT